jgi:polyhydroxybutyrate depolymerase
MSKSGSRMIRCVVLMGCAGFTVACSSADENEPIATWGTSAGTGGSISTGGVAPGGTGAGGTSTSGDSGGTTSSGGRATGGTGVGGAATGGVATGGTATGGVSSGGISSGGVATGGTGVTTGGVATGGVATGGTSTGGVSSGGISSGGVATGGTGVTTGGVATGGTATGGAEATGGSSTGGSSGGACSASGTLTAGDTRISLTVGGNEYPMIVHAPPSYDGTTRLPVVFDFHGLGGDENQMGNLSGWKSTGDAEGFITVFPGGVDNAWNAGFCCSDTPTDVDFVRQAIATLDSEGCIDTRRVYASGCSNGGGMSFRLACEAADVIAAVAPVDFDCAVGYSCADCSPSRPITEIQFRGTNDSAVPYDGAQPNFERWGEINGCSGSPEPLPQNSSCQRYPTCADGVETILCTVQNGSHCGSYSSFGIAELAWSVLQKYALP